MDDQPPHFHGHRQRLRGRFVKSGLAGFADHEIKKWSDYIDYWAVDWNFQNDTFMQDWVTYRTRRDRKLALTSDPHTYDRRGHYRVLVKVVDIFGNDTSQAFDVEVK